MTNKKKSKIYVAKMLLITKEKVLRLNYLPPTDVLLSITVSAPSGKMLGIVPKHLLGLCCE